MKTTAWKLIDGGKRRIRAEYGLRKLGEQEPYLSVTAEIQRAECGRWREDSCGCLHAEVVEHFPELRPLIPFHLTSERSGPMHYVANAVYHYQQGAWDFFKSTVVLQPGEAMPFEGRPLEEGETAEELTAWLLARLPGLMDKFRAALDVCGVERGT